MIALCHHIMPDGHQCGSPALRGEDYCHYHHPGRLPRPRKQRTRYPNFNPEIIAEIGSPEEIHQSLSSVLHALATDTIPLYQAQTMIYALKLPQTSLDKKKGESIGLQSGEHSLGTKRL